MRVIKFTGSIYSIDTFIDYVSSRYIYLEKGMASYLDLDLSKSVLIDDIMHVRVTSDMRQALFSAITCCNNGDVVSIGCDMHPIFSDRPYMREFFIVYDVL